MSSSADDNDPSSEIRDAFGEGHITVSSGGEHVHIGIGHEGLYVNRVGIDALISALIKARDAMPGETS